jgi:hypothetical protein
MWWMIMTAMMTMAMQLTTVMITECSICGPAPLHVLNGHDDDGNADNGDVLC